MNLKTFLRVSRIVGLSGCLFGCVTAKVITGPDGSPHQLITCPAVESCYAKAGEICGKYKIVNTSSNTSGASGNTSTTIDMLVKCEK